MEVIVQSLPSNRNYWFVRTIGGRWYKEFISSQYVAIGWNELKLTAIDSAQTEKELQEYVSQKLSTEKAKRQRLTAGHMIRFVKEMKKNDIIIIPNDGGTEYAFGEISGDVYEDESAVFVDDKNPTCDFMKRRKVNWIKRCKSSALDPALAAIKYAQPAINNLKDYAAKIDQVIGGFIYTKNDQGYMVLNAGSNGTIPVNDVLGFLSSLLAAAKEIDPNINTDDIGIKINMQSRGFLVFIGVPITILCLAAAVATISPTEIKFKASYKSFESSLEVKTTGSMDALLKYKEQAHRHDLEKLKKEAGKLKVSIPGPSCSDEIAED
jgi:hypothetical protein